MTASTRTAFELLREQAVEQPTAAAYIGPRGTISNGEFFERILAAAGSLIATGLDPDAVTGVTIADELDHLVVSLALLALATPQVNLPTFETPENRHGIAARTGVKQLVSDPSVPVADGLPVFPPSVVAGGGDTGAGRRAASGRGFAPKDAAIYRTTSGTSGTPKCFALSWERVAMLVDRISKTPSERRVLRTSSMEYDSTRQYRISSLLAGSTAVFAQLSDAASLAEVCRRAGVTEIHMGTYRLTSLLSTSRGDCILPQSTRLIVGGSRMPGPLRARTASVFGPCLWVQYATSEIGYISVARPEEHAEFPEGVGRPAPGVEVEIVDPDGHPVTPGTPGEAVVRKKGIPANYIGDAAASARLGPGWMRTQDILSRPPGGPLVFHGRADDMLILAGTNIFPSAIEDFLESLPEVAEAVAYGLPSRILGDIPVAAVVLKGDVGGTDPDWLLRHCRQKLGNQSPRRVHIVDRIPRTDLGKPLRRLLPGMPDESA